MRKSFTLPQFLQKRRLYVFQPYLYPSHLSLTPPFTERLSSTSTTKTPHINQPSPVSDPKHPAFSHAVFDDENKLRPLSRPLGQLQPPQPGENTGVDPRSWRERRDDFFDYDKHLARRKQLYVFLLTRTSSPRDRFDNRNFQLF